MSSDLRDLIARLKVDRQDAERHGYGCTEVGNPELTALITAAEASLSAGVPDAVVREAADRIAADRKRIEELEAALRWIKNMPLPAPPLDDPAQNMRTMATRALEGTTNG